jgi:hypothetical protein
MNGDETRERCIYTDRISDKQQLLLPIVDGVSTASQHGWVAATPFYEF